MNRSLTIFWIAAVAAGLTTGCVAINPVIGVDTTAVTGTERYSESLEKVVDGAGLSRLTARTTNGAVSVRGTSRPTVTVRITKEVRAATKREAQAFSEKIRVTVVRSGSTVTVTRSHPRPPGGVQVSVSYDIDLPEGADADLVTTNGGVAIKGITGRIEAETTNGGVELRSTTGPVTVRTTNGNISAYDIRLAEGAEYRTTNGSIQANVVAGVSPITAVTTNGSIALALPVGFSGQLDARTSNGRVSSSLTVGNATLSTKTRLVGRLGHGGGARVRLTTSNGNVDLRPQR